MRLIVWILGVECTLAALMQAYAVRPGWVWVFWCWLGLWVLVGLVVLIAAAVRVFAPRQGRAGGVASVPQRSVPPAHEGGE